MKNPQFVLATFCNSTESTTSPVLCMKIPFPGQESVEFAPVNLGYPGFIDHATGLATAGDKIFVAFRVEGMFYLACLSQQELTPLFYQELPEARDVHSILALSNCLYIVSSSTDEVLVYDVLQTGLANPRVFWRATLEQKDIHHLNSIVEIDGELFISAFGPKTGNLWASARNGYIHNISRNSRVMEGIYHPHSLSARNGQLYYCESQEGSFCSLENKILQLSGYSRGVSWLSDERVCIATSIGRKVSRSTGQFGSTGDPGDPIGQCGLTILDIINNEKLMTVDFSWFGSEIYDVLVLADQKIDLLKLAASAQMAERQAIQPLLREKAQMMQIVVERKQQRQPRSSKEGEQKPTEILKRKVWNISLLFPRFRTLVAHSKGHQARTLLGIIDFLISGSNRANPSHILGTDLVLSRSSDFFDAPWYLRNNPDIAEAKLDPLRHYLLFGGFEGRDPSPNFSSQWYLDTYEEVKKAGINPLVHFLKNGRSEGRFPNLESLENDDLALLGSSGLFDEVWYLTNNPDIARARIDPLLHYLRNGGFEGRDPGPNFSSKWYLSTYKDVKKAKVNPLVHYLKYGLREGRKAHGDPIFVYTMGKVGSTTVAQSLLDAFNAIGTRFPFRHAHALNVTDAAVQKVLQEMPNPVESLEEMARIKKLREEIDKDPEQRWNIVSLVRDPVARNIATLFQALSGFVPDWRQRYMDGRLSVRELQELLFSTSIINGTPNQWFDDQMKRVPAFGIDVYAEPFPKEIGYKIYPGAARARLLLIRMENLNDCAESAMREFLGLENFALNNTNIGAEKDYADLYRAFTNQPLPVEYVQKMYNTQFARHFYTEAELLAFAKRWTGVEKMNLSGLGQNP